MVDIQSKEVIDKISELLKIQPSLVIPRGISKDIQLVFDVNSENIITDTTGISDVAIKTTSGGFIALVTPANKDFYLTSLDCSFIKDATCDTATGGYLITALIGGRPTNLVSFPIITLTAQTDSKMLQFNPPIKLDRGSDIVFGGTFTLGVCVRSLNVAGFTRDPQ